MDKILYHSVRLNCEPEQAFKMFTVNEHLESWLTMKAEVEPKIGGKYELFWKPEDRENDSTLGCKITAIESNRLLSFEWRGPKQYKHFMNEADPLTHVVVSFIPCNKINDQSPCTEVYLVHSGWRSSAEWEEARLWFKKAWQNAFEDLKKLINKTKHN
ncbi:MAG: SRPBCC domain-containing protein [Promethearchaeota archaeon]